MMSLLPGTEPWQERNFGGFLKPPRARSAHMAAQAKPA